MAVGTRSNDAVSKGLINAVIGEAAKHVVGKMAPQKIGSPEKWTALVLDGIKLEGRSRGIARQEIETAMRAT
jgi:hypothetical protein